MNMGTLGRTALVTAMGVLGSPLAWAAGSGMPLLKKGLLAFYVVAGVAAVAVVIYCLKRRRDNR